MDINLYSTGSERERIVKTLSLVAELEGALRGESSVISPSFLIECENPSAANYCYIPDFGRYYYITNMISVRTGIWRIDCSVDVLMSYQSEILAMPVIVDFASQGDSDSPTYMNHGDVWLTTVKSKTDVINFPYGLLDDGEYILITSGGVAS